MLIMYVFSSVCAYFPTAPTAPTSLMVVSITNSTVSLSWMSPDKPNGIITQYQVQYRRADNSSRFTSLNRTYANLKYTVTGLTGNTKYVFRVRAFTVVGHGPSSNEVITYTSKYQCYDSVS